MAQLPTLGNPQLQMPQYDFGASRDLARAQQTQLIARALMQQGYIPNSGALGALAQVISGWKGGKLAKQADESVADALERQLKSELEMKNFEFTRKQQDEERRDRRNYEQQVRLAEAQANRPQFQTFNDGSAGYVTPPRSDFGSLLNDAQQAEAPQLPQASDPSVQALAVAKAMQEAGLPDEQIQAVIAKMPGMIPATESEQAAGIPDVQAGSTGRTPQVSGMGAVSTPPSQQSASGSYPGVQMVRPPTPKQTAPTELQTRIAEMEKRGMTKEQIDAYLTGEKPMTAGQKEQLRVKRSKARSSMNGVTQDLDMMVTKIDELLNPQANLEGITGWSGVFPNNPGGTAANAQSKLESLQNQTGFQVLQKMRLLSPTGGALGNVSDRENERLDTAIQNLGKAQSAESLRKALADLKTYALQSKQLMQEAYANDYGAEDMDEAAKGGGSEIDMLLNKYAPKK